MKDYYKILGLSFESEPELELIKSAYKTLVKLYHPDVFQRDQEKFKRNILEINEAYEILQDKNKRENYDRKLKDFLKKNNKQYSSNIENSVNYYKGGSFENRFNINTEEIDEIKNLATEKFKSILLNSGVNKAYADTQDFCIKKLKSEFGISSERDIKFLFYGLNQEYYQEDINNGIEPYTAIDNYLFRMGKILENGKHSKFKSPMEYFLYVIGVIIVASFFIYAKFFK